MYLVSVWKEGNWDKHIQRKDDLKTGRRKPSTSQGERPLTDPFLAALRRNIYRHFDLRFLNFRTEKLNFCCLSHQTCGTCYSSSSKLVHPIHLIGYSCCFHHQKRYRIQSFLTTSIGTTLVLDIISQRILAMSTSLVSMLPPSHSYSLSIEASVMLLKCKLNNMTPCMPLE